MATRTHPRDSVPADPGGLAWTLLLTAALVIIIGLIAYLVFRGDVVPHRVADPARMELPNLPDAPNLDPPRLPQPIPAR